MREKPLRQILRIVWVCALAAQKQKDWSPINPAKFRYRAQRLRRRCLRFPGVEDHRPPSGGEQTLARCFGGKRRRHATFLSGRRKISKPNMREMRWLRLAGNETG